MCCTVQEFEASLSELKPRVTKALELGKQLKENCSSIDGPHISDQLDQLNNAWSQLNSDSLTRKHSLEDGLLQLGQFQDALGELLAWILDSTAKLSNAPLPGVKVGKVETQLRDLQVRALLSIKMYISTGACIHALMSYCSLWSTSKDCPTRVNTVHAWVILILDVVQFVRFNRRALVPKLSLPLPI